MKKFYKSLKEDAIDIINFQNKNDTINKGTENYTKSEKFVIFAKKSSYKSTRKIKTNDFHYIGKYGGTAYSIFNSKNNVPNEIPIVFYNGSNYDYHFVIKKLVKQFKREFNFLRKKYCKKTIPFQFNGKRN